MSFKNTTRRAPGSKNKYYSPDGRILIAHEVGRNGLPASNVPSRLYVPTEQTGQHSSGENDRAHQRVQYHGMDKEAF